MKKLILSEKDSWIAYDEIKYLDMDEFEIIADLQRRVLSTQTWFFDLDDTQSYSPAKLIAMKAMGTSYFNPEYMAWCIGTGISLALHGKDCESDQWNQYTNSFLRKPETIEKIKQEFDLEYAHHSLFPGVREFCSALHPQSRKHYITRNIAEIAQVYSQALDFDKPFFECYDKENMVEKYILDNPHIQSYGLQGDSPEDGAIIDMLRHYNKRITSFYVMKHFGEADPRFSYSISRNQKTLANIISKFSQSQGTKGKDPTPPFPDRLFYLII